MGNNLLKPDYIFEISWEVCNKAGGIHTVLVTRANTMVNQFKDNYICIGPDIVKEDKTYNEFILDDQLYPDWRLKAESEGLRIKIGRWSIPASPLVILIDFSVFIQQKNEIFKEFWDKFKLDSLSGQWDYIEPTLFGYAAGKVIESFTLFNLSTYDKIIAHFHEWVTGAGILYLVDRLPQIATVFTTHSTILGKALAGSHRSLYKNLSFYNADEVAREYNAISKYSLERLTAKNADTFSTVSELTAKECRHFLQKNTDLLTPNGFDDSLINPGESFKERRQQARKKLLEVASVLFNKQYDGNTFLLTTSGRYELRNKGIDIFIETLGELNKSNDLHRETIAFILVPTNHYGPRKDLSQGHIENYNTLGSCCVTHNLHDEEWDSIIQKLERAGIQNKPENKLKVIYVPSFLNGKDGIINLDYYSLLPAFDLTVYPAYYEPWGYSALESVMFLVPTIVTSLMGFAQWIQKKTNIDSKAISIIERNDDNEDVVKQKIIDSFYGFLQLDNENYDQIRKEAYKIATSLFWDELYVYYEHAYDIALQKTMERTDRFVEIEEKQTHVAEKPIETLVDTPKWNQIVVKSKLPDNLKKLDELVQNLWWTWDEEAKELVTEIDEELCEHCDYNPIVLFEQVSYDRFLKLSRSKNYVEKLDRVYDRYKSYISDSIESIKPKIAYFSMEYGLHSSLKTYSGGLGILAGDYLKEASDAKVNITAIGLLYRYGYFEQIITLNGEQQNNYEYQHFSQLPVHAIRDEQGEQLKIRIMLPGRPMYARIWRVDVGRVPLYLLDTDIDENSAEDRFVTHYLYGGDNENRLKQELLLGIGGVRVLELLGIKPDLFHSNEGHSAFIGFERMRNYINNENLTFSEAREIVSASTLFTTHTPVPAGHDKFDEDLLRKYIAHYPERLSVSWNELIAMGKIDPNNKLEKFNMSHLAANLAQEINGVSMLHGDVARDMFVPMWPGYLSEELHIGYVTNGVHLSTWTAREWKELYLETFGEDYLENPDNRELWAKIMDLPDETIWNTKNKLRARLIKAVKERFKENWIKRHEDPQQIFAINNKLSEHVLTICFARRFATYKRAHLLFRNLERLAKIINYPERPIQFIFAGKAHPQDKLGQDLIKMITEISKRPEFLGRILFLQNYDMNMAKLLVQGADIWLNTPTRPLEASGTSGQKAVLNGTIHFSVLDGWWVEGYQPGAGWALTNERTYEDQSNQDDLDAEIIYSTLETEITKAYYTKNKNGIPEEWVQIMKNSISQVAPKFTTRRMISNYQTRYYSKLYDRAIEISENEFELAKKIAFWKKRISKSWKSIELEDVKGFDMLKEEYFMGGKYKLEVVLNLNDVLPEDVGMELIIAENGKLIERYYFEQYKLLGNKAFYRVQVTFSTAGSFNYGIRIYPINSLLPHRQDIRILKWV